MYTNRGIINEYYDTVKDALRIELKREPTEEEIMEVVNKFIKRCYE